MLKLIKNKYSEKLSKLLVVILALAIFGFQPLHVNAASLTSVKDTLTRIEQAQTADHTISFTLPGGASSFVAGDKMSIDFPANFVTLGSGWVAGDFTFNDGTARTISNVGINSAPSCTAGTNNLSVEITSASDLFVFTACSTFTANSSANVTITIDGTTTDGTLTNPSSPETSVVAIVGDDKGNGFGSDDDTASLAIPIIADDTVTITATVDPTITFSISDTAISFGTLSSAAARYATGDGTSTSSDPAAGAHNLQISTNATSGYIVTYKGATLTSGANTIDVPGSFINNDANGTPGQEEFALSVNRQTGTGTVAANYQYTDPDWDFDANTTTTIYTQTAATNTETLEIHYLANIAGATQAGTYTTDVTYIATGTF